MRWRRPAVRSGCSSCTCTSTSSVSGRPSRLASSWAASARTTPLSRRRRMRRCTAGADRCTACAISRCGVVLSRCRMSRMARSKASSFKGSAAGIWERKLRERPRNRAEDARVAQYIFRMSSSLRTSAFIPLLAIFGSVTFLGLGTSWAKHTLFPLVGAQGTTAVRVGFSALLLLLLWRPWRWRLARSDLRAIALYGAALGLMNLTFYLSLLPLGHDVSTLDPLGVAYALVAAVCWATYILFGKRVGHLHAGLSVSLGLTVAALVVLPVGLAHSGMALLSWQVLAVGLGVAAISSAVPISLEMVALKRLPPQAVGIMISMEPAVAAVLALGLLDERLSVMQWLAIGLIVMASVGCAATARSAPQESRRSSAASAPTLAP